MKPEFSSRDMLEEQAATESMQEQKEAVLQDLKPDPNNFLFSRVPYSMTIAQFEVLTTDIYSRIDKAWDVVA